MSYKGTVKNGVVVLPPEAKLPDGTPVEVFADEDAESKRPSARSEIRTRPILSDDEFARWFVDALQEERRLKDLDAKQRGVFELR